MRFGHFYYPMKFDDSRDEEAIRECLAEAELVEELGFDAIWLAEHYFTGECVYGDPLVFAGALAVKTRRVDIGFGILELPLHNPVRVAIQTALLDNLTRGRVIVGTAKGSNYNAYEYIGFGTNPDLGVEQLDEAEDLLVQAWTTDNLEFRGKHYRVAFPSSRPRPYQKPHPRLARACIDDESVKAMARIGRPILLRGRSTNHTAASIRLYRDTMAEAGFGEEAIERNLDQIWVWRELHLAETDDQAMTEFSTGPARGVGQHAALPHDVESAPIQYGSPAAAHAAGRLRPHAQTRTPGKRWWAAPNGSGATGPNARRRHPQPDANQPWPGVGGKDGKVAEDI